MLVGLSTPSACRHCLAVLTLTPSCDVRQYRGKRQTLAGIQTAKGCPIGTPVLPPVLELARGNDRIRAKHERPSHSSFRSAVIENVGTLRALCFVAPTTPTPPHRCFDGLVRCCMLTALRPQILFSHQRPTDATLHSSPRGFENVHTCCLTSSFACLPVDSNSRWQQYHSLLDFPA